MLQNGTRYVKKWCPMSFQQAWLQVIYILSFFQFPYYVSLSLSVISTSLAQTCCKCCNLLVSVVLNVGFITNEMGMENNIHVAYMWRKQSEIKWTWRVISMLPQFEALRTCCSGFPIATKWCCYVTRMWRWCEVQPEPTTPGITTLEIHHSTRFTLL